MPVILFDLDDTLYLEEDYVRSGFRAVSHEIADRTSLDADALFDQLWYDFRRLGRTGIFDRLVKNLGQETISVPLLVEIYRDHEPKIELLPEAAALLKSLAASSKIGIVTDGAPAMQKRKVTALSLEPLVDTIVYSWEAKAPKPSPQSFLIACETFGAAVSEAVIVGDDPFHDVEAARTGGFRMIRVLTGRAREVRTRVPPPGYVEIESLHGIHEALHRLGIKSL